MKRFFKHLQAMCYTQSAMARQVTNIHTLQSAMARQIKNATQATNALQSAMDDCKVRQGDFSLSLSLSLV